MQRRGSWMHKGGKHADSRRTHAEKCQPKQQVRTPAAFILHHDGCISGNQDNDEDQGNRHHAIDHGGIDQSFDRINPDEVEQQSNDGCHRDDAIKPPRLGEFLVQSLSPLQALCHLCWLLVPSVRASTASRMLPPASTTCRADLSLAKPAQSSLRVPCTTTESSEPDPLTPSSPPTLR